MKIILSEEQFRSLILAESDNPAYERNKANGENMRAIWAEIDRKQKLLQKYVFGELSERIYDLTAEKAKQMSRVKPGVNFMQVPKNMFTAGNKKLPQNVLIVNMSSALMCPSYYLGLCEITNGSCYAMNDENHYSRTDMGSTLRNNWQRDLLNTQMLQQYKMGNKTPMKEYFRLIELYIQLGNAYAKNLFRQSIDRVKRRKGGDLTPEAIDALWANACDTKITDVRLNESGDFHCQLAVDLWAKFAEKIRRKYGINTHAYTARGLDFSDASKHMAINFSNHNSMNMGDAPRTFKAVRNSVYNSYVGGDQVVNGQPVLGKTENGTYFYKCPCSDDEKVCDKCGVCFNMNKTGVPYTIIVRYHSMDSAEGIKNLFKQEEIKNVMNLMKNNGWATENETEASEKPAHLNKMNNFDTKIDNKRNGIEPPKKNNRKKTKPAAEE